MNQIIDKNYMFNKKIYVEFSNEIAEIPYEESKVKFKARQYIKNNKYKIQFFTSFFVAIISSFVFLLNFIKTNTQEKISKKLLNNYSLTTLYQDNNLVNSEDLYKTPFVVGIIKINKINLNYPILSESNDDLLKISVCRFAGAMPNETGNLCIAGHNYIDDRFFSRLEDLLIGDEIEIYDLNGKQILYEVYGKYLVNANDLSCTEQKVGNKKIVTLITCNNLNNSKRLVVQAQEK